MCLASWPLGAVGQQQLQQRQQKLAPLWARHDPLPKSFPVGMVELGEAPRDNARRVLSASILSVQSSGSFTVHSLLLLSAYGEHGSV